MTDLSIVAIVLAVALPISLGVVVFGAFLVVKSSLSYLENTATVGGQPRDFAVKQLVFTQEEKAKDRAIMREKIRPMSPSEVISGS